MFYIINILLYSLKAQFTEDWLWAQPSMGLVPVLWTELGQTWARPCLLLLLLFIFLMKLPRIILVYWVCITYTVRVLTQKKKDNEGMWWINLGTCATYWHMFGVSFCAPNFSSKHIFTLWTQHSTCQHIVAHRDSQHFFITEHLFPKNVRAKGLIISNCERNNILIITRKDL